MVVYSTVVEYYIQRQQVILYSGSSNGRYDIVYSKSLTLNKGVDNTIQFQFLNQEQKPVDITDRVISFRLIKYDGTVTFLRKQLTSLLPLKGLAVLELGVNEIVGIEPQQCYYSLDIVDGNKTNPIFVSPDAEARGLIKVVDGVLPSFVPSMSVSIPSHPAPNIFAGITFYSSIANTLDNPLFSTMFNLQMNLTNFTGNVDLQGATTGTGDWYDLTPLTTYSSSGNSFTSSTESIMYTVDGYHPYVRVVYSDVKTGSVDNLLLR